MDGKKQKKLWGIPKVEKKHSSKKHKNHQNEAQISNVGTYQMGNLEQSQFQCLIEKVNNL